MGFLSIPARNKYRRRIEQSVPDLQRVLNLEITMRQVRERESTILREYEHENTWWPLRTEYVII